MPDAPYQWSKADLSLRHFPLTGLDFLSLFKSFDRSPASKSKATPSAGRECFFNWVLTVIAVSGNYVSLCVFR